MSQPHSSRSVTDDAASWPAVVQRAVQFADTAGFTRSCLPEVGRLLAMLAASVTDGSIGEIGTGAGVAAAWLASGKQPGVPLISVEHDLELVALAQEALAHEADVTLLSGDWRLLLAHGPFRLLFVDVTDAKHSVDAVIAALAPGGIAVLDDLTPIEQWPEEWRGKPDRVRDAWLLHPALQAVEIRTSATAAAIIAVRRQDAASPVTGAATNA